LRSSSFTPSSSSLRPVFLVSSTVTTTRAARQLLSRPQQSQRAPPPSLRCSVAHHRRTTVSTPYMMPTCALEKPVARVSRTLNPSQSVPRGRRHGRRYGRDCWSFAPSEELHLAFVV
jgi:hypothetical protein